MQKVMLIGGPGNITLSTLEGLLEKNCEVAVFTHPKKDLSFEKHKVRWIWGDRNHAIELQRSIEAFKPDIVIDSVCFNIVQAQQVADLLSGRVSQYIFISTVDVYGFPLSRIPMRESDLFTVPNCQYAADKKACEDFFQSRFDRDRFPLTIVRPAYSFGPRFVISFFSRDGGRYLLSRLKAGKPVLIPGDGTTQIHVSTAYNTGKMIARIAGCGEAVGKSYNCAHESAITQYQYVQLFAQALGVEPNPVFIPKDFLLSVNSREMNESIYKILTCFDLSFSVEAFKSDFPGFKWELTLEEAAQQYVAWNLQQGLLPGIEEETIEDRLIDAYSHEMVSDLKK